VNNHSIFLLRVTKGASYNLVLICYLFLGTKEDSDSDSQSSQSDSENEIGEQQNQKIKDIKGITLDLLYFIMTI